MKKLSKIFTICLMLNLFSCADQNMEKYQEKVGLEAQENANAEINAQRKRAQEMELDLSRVHNFYDSLSGQYIGNFKAGGTLFKVKATFKPTVDRYTGGRIRTLSEIENDFMNLRLVSNVTVIADEFASGCVYTNIRPLYKQGQINLVNEDCKLSYEVYLKESTNIIFDPVESQAVADRIFLGQMTEVSNILVTKKSVYLPEDTTFILTKK